LEKKFLDLFEIWNCWSWTKKFAKNENRGSETPINRAFHFQVLKKSKMTAILGEKRKFSKISIMEYCNIGEVEIYG